MKLFTIYTQMGYIPNAIHSECPFESFKMMVKRSASFFFFKHVLCGLLATDQGKCHSLFKLLFYALFLNLCALAVHRNLPMCILRIEESEVCCLFSQTQET